MARSRKHDARWTANRLREIASKSAVVMALVGVWADMTGKGGTDARCAFPRCKRKAGYLEISGRLFGKPIERHWCLHHAHAPFDLKSPVNRYVEEE